MSTIAEIENAVERLPAAELSKFAAWFDEYQQAINASAQVFALYDKEEEKSCSKPSAENCG